MSRVWILLGLMPCVVLAQVTGDKGIRLKSPKAADVYSEQRVALVIGNAGYHTDPLRNPVNDADDIAKTLSGRKFDVVKVTNADKRGMEEAIEIFGGRLKKMDAPKGTYISYATAPGRTAADGDGRNGMCM